MQNSWSEMLPGRSHTTQHASWFAVQTQHINRCHTRYRTRNTPKCRSASRIKSKSEKWFTLFFTIGTAILGLIYQKNPSKNPEENLNKRNFQRIDDRSFLILSLSGERITISKPHGDEHALSNETSRSLKMACGDET